MEGKARGETPGVGSLSADSSRRTRRGTGQELVPNPATENSQTGGANREDPAGALNIVCPGCGRDDFGNKAGLTMHRKRCQPGVLNSERARSQANKRSQPWTAEEVYMLAKRHAELLRDGEAISQRGVAEKLARGSGRSVEMIRGRLKYPSYAEVLTAVRQEIDSENLNADVSAETLHEQQIENEKLFTDYFDGLGEKLVTEGPINSTWTSVEVEERLKLWLEAKGWREPTPKSSKPRARETEPSGTLSNRKQKALLLQKTRLLWEENPAGCVKRVLDGNVLLTAQDIPDPIINYWEELTKVVPPHSRDPLKTVRAPLWELDGPLRECEVEAALANVDAKTACGPDGISGSWAKKVDAGELTQWGNIFLYCGCAPRLLNDARVALIPKVEKPSAGSDYRPIAVGSVLLRIVHSALDKRLCQVPLGAEQKGFRPLDGCRDHLFAVKGLVGRARREARDLLLCFVDVKNAFGSVAHEYLFEACRAVGVPPRLLRYIRGVYSESFVRFGASPRQVRLGAGIRQGDPLSGGLFNLVMEIARLGLDPKVGSKCGDGVMSSLLFADDAILISESVAGMVNQIKTFGGILADAGMALNAKKCSTLAMRVLHSRNGNSSFVDDRYKFGFAGEKFPAMGPQEFYKYLGVKIGAVGVNLDPAVERLQAGLNMLRDSCLRPQEKTWGLKTVVLPRALHQLVLGDASRPLLKRLDIMVRGAIRSWLKLPKDTPLGMFHASAQDGGLGVPCLDTHVYRLRRDRLGKLEQTSDRNLRVLVDDPTIRPTLERALKVREFKGRPILSAADEKLVWRDRLYESKDGSGLRVLAASINRQSRWVDDPQRFKLKGGEYIRALHTRLGLLPTGERTTRGATPDKSRRMCKRCHQVQSLGHIVNNCPWSHGHRVRRHAEFCDSIAKRLRKLGWEVLEEPRVPLGKTFCKPDIVARKGNRAVVLDPTIIGASQKPLQAYLSKVATYDKPEVKAVAESMGSGKTLEHIAIHGIVMSIRGVWCPISWTALKGLGFSQFELQWFAVRLLNSVWACWRDECRWRT